LVRWLGRVGVVRNDDGLIVGALSLQLPGDTAAYASLSRESSVDTYNPLDSSSVSVSSFAGEGYMHHKRRTPDGDEESQPSSACCCPAEYSQLGLFNALRFRYKHAIITDHVCTPGEAYVDFLCVMESAQREGVGSRLMQWAELSAEQLGCGRIALSVWGAKEKSKYFYGNLGINAICGHIPAYMVSHLFVRLCSN
jgi:GNAT superfamily N-acetyltransferase